MNHDRLVNLQVSGFKSLSEVDISLDGLTVLIGENGSGKSAILEAMTIFASAAERLVHVQDVIERHFGSFETLLCQNNSALYICGTIRGEGEDLHYGFQVGSSGVDPVVSEEWLYRGSSPHNKDPEDLLMARRGRSCKFRRIGGPWEETSVGPQALLLGSLGGGTTEEIARVVLALESIQIHPPFDARPIRQQRELGVKEGPRWPQPIEAAPKLRPYGVNLPSAYHQLRNTGGQTWERVLQLARLGLGDDLRDILLPAAGRGNIELDLVFGSLTRPIHAEGLSEGQICYLCFIALAELSASRAALAIDECELHLHPDLVGRVIWMLEDAALNSPVLLTTHSDRMLDALENPAKSVLLCELDAKRRTVLRRPNSDALKEWLKDYSGLGTLRAEGNQEHVFEDATAPSEGQ